MRAVCLIVIVTLMLQVTFSMFLESSISKCCDKPINCHLKSKNIKSYNRTNDQACKTKAFIVKLKTNQTICANATFKGVISAIDKFDAKRKALKT